MTKWQKRKPKRKKPLRKRRGKRKRVKREEDKFSWQFFSIKPPPPLAGEAFSFLLPMSSFTPLKNITVVDVSRLIPGPFCSLLLSHLGARVIKVENPKSPDYLREVPPFVDDEQGALYSVFNCNKKIVLIDYLSPQGRQKFQNLVKKADVLIESFRPGVFKKMGYSFSQLKKINSKIILTSISGFGQKGSYAHLAGHDLNYMSLSGMLNPPLTPYVQLADLVGGGLWGAFSILAALLQQGKNKKALHLDISMTDAMSFLGLGSVILGQMGVSQNILTGILARYRLYATKDQKFVCLAALEDKFWLKFCDLIEKPQWKEDYSYFRDTDSKIHQELEEIFKEKNRSDWEKLGKQYDLCLTPVLTPFEVLESPHYQNRKFYQTVPFKKKTLKVPLLPLAVNGKVNRGVKKGILS